MSTKPLSKKVRSFFMAVLIIGTATAGGVLFADFFLATDRNSRAVQADISEFSGWIASFDIYIVTVVVAVAVLIGIAIYARNKA
jgi:uncharacterized membrane protein